MKQTNNKKYIIKGTKLFLKFPHNKETITKIKQLPYHYHNIEKSYYIIYNTSINLALIKEWGFTLFNTKKLVATLHKTNIEITKENRHPELHFQALNNYSFLKKQIKLSEDRGTWYLPNSLNVINLLKRYKYEIEEIEKLDDVDDVDYTQIELPDEITNYRSKNGESFHPFQLEAIKFGIANNGNAIIGDEQGIGKTIEALGYLLANPHIRPALIICKSTAKINWQREIREWLPNEFAMLLRGRKSNGDISPLFSIYIINYDILHARLNQILTEIKPKIIIPDECQAVKNQDAMRTHAFKWLCQGTIEEKETGEYLINRKKLKVIPMSGTPIKSRAEEFFTILNIVNPKEFPTWEWYRERYCFSVGGFYSKRLKKERLLELHEILKRVMIRRLKKDVLPELPDKVRTVIPLEITNRDEYNKAEKNFITWVRENFGVKAATAATKAEQLVYINRMKKLAVQGKMKGMLEWIDDFLDSGEKLVVFCSHSFVVQILSERYPNSVKLVGGMSDINKQNSIDSFQDNKEINLFIGNMEAAGDSITLTAASNVAFLELGWTPADHTQPEDRLHRKGQKNAVNCYYLVADRTVEMHSVSLLSEKMKTLGAILDGKEVADEDILTGLMKKYREMENEYRS